jgi:hypothetical protein
MQRKGGAEKPSQYNSDIRRPDEVMNDCEMLEWDDRFEPSVNGNKKGNGADWRRSSHGLVELVELASGWKNPALAPRRCFCKFIVDPGEITDCDLLLHRLHAGMIMII